MAASVAQPCCVSFLDSEAEPATETRIAGSACAGDDESCVAASQLSADCWARCASFLPLVAWVQFVGLSCTSREAVRRTVQSEAYQDVELELDFGLAGSNSAAERSLIACIQHLRIGALRVHVDPAREHIPELELPSSVQALKLCDGAWRLFSDTGVWRMRSQCNWLLFLDLSGLSGAGNRGLILQKCIRLGMLQALRELRAGSDGRRCGDISGWPDTPDTVIQQLPKLSAAAPNLEALDVNHAWTDYGLGEWECLDLLQSCRSLRHLDLSGVMRFRNFDSVLQGVAALALQRGPTSGLESLAVHGLEMSSDVLQEFCQACRHSIRNLKFNFCSIHPSSVDMLFSLPNLQRIDLRGTLLIARQIESSALGGWLREKGHTLREVRLCGVIYPEMTSDDNTELIQILEHAKAWCRDLCTQAEQCDFEFTAVTSQHAHGFPLEVQQLRRLLCDDAPRFFERICPTGYGGMRRINAGNFAGPWACTSSPADTKSQEDDSFACAEYDAVML